MIRSFAHVKILDIRKFFTNISGHKYNTEILDMSRKFWMHGNPSLLHYLITKAMLLNNV